jgi:hypothetical protein
MTVGNVFRHKQSVERANLFKDNRDSMKTMERLGRLIECVSSLFYCVYNRVEFPPAFHVWASYYLIKIYFTFLSFLTQNYLPLLIFLSARTLCTISIPDQFQVCFLRANPVTCSPGSRIA